MTMALGIQEQASATASPAKALVQDSENPEKNHPMTAPIQNGLPDEQAPDNPELEQSVAAGEMQEAQVPRPKKKVKKKKKKVKAKSSSRPVSVVSQDVEEVKVDLAAHPANGLVLPTMTSPPELEGSGEEPLPPTPKQIQAQVEVGDNALEFLPQAEGAGGGYKESLPPEDVYHPTSPTQTVVLLDGPEINPDYVAQMEKEIKTLRRMLSDAHNALDETRAQLEEQRAQTRQIVLSWKARIYEADDNLKRQKQQRDQEMKEVTSQLLFFESELKTERERFNKIIAEKDSIIARQQSKLRELKQRNIELRATVEGIMPRLPSHVKMNLSFFLLDEDDSAADISHDAMMAGLPPRGRTGSTSQNGKSVKFDLHRRGNKHNMKRSRSLPNCNAPRNRSILKNTSWNTSMDDAVPKHLSMDFQGLEGGFSELGTQAAGQGALSASADRPGTLGTDFLDASQPDPQDSLPNTDPTVSKHPTSAKTGRQSYASPEFQIKVANHLGQGTAARPPSGRTGIHYIPGSEAANRSIHTLPKDYRRKAAHNFYFSGMNSRVASPTPLSPSSSRPTSPTSPQLAEKSGKIYPASRNVPTPSDTVATNTDVPNQTSSADNSVDTSMDSSTSSSNQGKQGLSLKARLKKMLFPSQQELKSKVKNQQQEPQQQASSRSSKKDGAVPVTNPAPSSTKSGDNSVSELGRFLQLSLPEQTQ